ncbi:MULTISPECIES: helix-turn-helix transcriptional regulator [unclassified Bradyrhizobium]|uniref:helix-turn-helix transcriptional regulator n=1 Tax=unclassified Bradyrhizobium TaxID=2631580 RepID=UPI0028F0838F|nr:MULTISPECIES: helix-turn-helix transcriptional regulator [unclassified Bradyrhizobium]
MNRLPDLRKTYSFIEAIERAEDAATIQDELLRVVAKLGATYLACSILPEPGLLRFDRLNRILLNALPPLFVEEYYGAGLVYRDLKIRLLRSLHPPFLWSEMQRSHVLDRPTKHILQLANGCGLRDGLEIAIPTLDTWILSFTIAGDKLEIHPDDRARLAHLASITTSRLLYLRRRSELAGSVKLTVRELEALNWAAKGKTLDGIAPCMKISRHGVDYLMRRVREKLGVKTVNEAISKAFQLGLLR